MGIRVNAYLQQVASIAACVHSQDDLHERTYASPVFCPDETAAVGIMEAISLAKEQGDSVGGVVEFIASGIPPGLGDPVYDKLEARLAYAMMGLPAAKGFEIGSGFQSTAMTGSEHNDAFVVDNGTVVTQTNHAGGTLGGISTGMPLVGRVAFKPTSSVRKEQTTVDHEGQKAVLALPAGSRHDPCVAIRAVPIVEAMAALVLADAVLLNRCSRV